ncbi:hypothetical protein RFI_38529 [Reticulomyxa filosa]|uniref:Uncharacterized protein n=1 Tax=Reticulomyxa filosa TaxID=46433 RepID=X6LBQ7_RETFI|nr:hypothetical protein RFI_38529 [Reticulomyxa filosa]|eukprot:ETN98958.1 hypothetical protein RFI_38529 [Reticulomyxa filosa]
MEATNSKSGKEMNLQESDIEKFLCESEKKKSFYDNSNVYVQKKKGIINYMLAALFQIEIPKKYFICCGSNHECKRRFLVHLWKEKCLPTVSTACQWSVTHKLKSMDYLAQDHLFFFFFFNIILITSCYLCVG